MFGHPQKSPAFLRKLNIMPEFLFLNIHDSSWSIYQAIICCLEIVWYVRFSFNKT